MLHEKNGKYLVCLHSLHPDHGKLASDKQMPCGFMLHFQTHPLSLFFLGKNPIVDT